MISNTPITPSSAPLQPRQGLYVHIPFCQSRCIYCDFYSTTQHLNSQDAYTAAIIGEMNQRAGELPLEQLDTIYIGGGTPSVFSAKNLERIINNAKELWRVGGNAEITVEANPDDITPAYAAALKAAGANRVSMGAQTFNDNLLHLLGRRHSAHQISQAIDHLLRADIRNISIDLIYGLPRQSLEMWKSDLRQAFSLPISHLSAYALIYEEDTPLFRLMEKGKVAEADDELEFEMYQALMDEAEAHGFLHYEISNFAIPHRQARHNSGYWHGMRYLGLGPAAHSYNGATRRWNLPHLDAYITANGLTGLTPQPPMARVNTHALGDNTTEAGTDRSTNRNDAAVAPSLFGYEHLSPMQREEEMLLTSLRTARGLSMNAYSLAFGEAATRRLLLRARPFINSGDIALSALPASTFSTSSSNSANPLNISSASVFLRLTRKSLFRSDGIIASLFEE